MQEKANLIAKIREMAGGNLPDEVIEMQMEIARRICLEETAIAIVTYIAATDRKTFEVFVDNEKYDRFITKLRANENNIEVFVVEVAEDTKVGYWSDIADLSGPELVGLKERFEILLGTLEDERKAV